MTENRPTRRPWFRFSLRTLLVLITLVCVYLGWALNWKRQRQEFLDSAEGGYVDRSDDPFHDPQVAAPIWIRILGAPGYSTVYLLSREKNEQQFNEAQRLFPEADIFARWKLEEEQRSGPATSDPLPETDPF